VSISLRTKVFLPLLVLMAMLIGYLYSYWMPRSLANMERQCRDATERHLDSVVEGVIPLMLGRELDSIYENLDALHKKNSDWLLIYLTDADGRLLYPLEASSSDSPEKYIRNISLIKKRIRYLDMDLGALIVAVDFEAHLKELRDELRNAVSVMLGVIAVIVLSIGLVLERKVVLPVKTLGRAAQDLANGKFDNPHLEAGKDEVGDLVNSFQTMSENLAASYTLLSLSEQKSRAITTTANDAIIMMDENGNISFWNPAAENTFGYSAEEVLGKYLHRIIAPDRYVPDYEKGLRDFNETGKGEGVGKTIELTALKKDGTEFPVELSLSALKMNDRWHAVGIVRDITQRKLVQKQMLESLKEKELLLQEIHHRVKNNMQVITSLLDLQLDYIGGRQPAEIFSDIKNRIRSMSLVHEKLYHSRDLSRVDFQDYVTSLVSNLYKFYDASPERIKLNLDIEDIFFGIDTAIPCGLIVNELITNSLKYAFPGDREGEVGLRLNKTGEGSRGEGIYSLLVRDNGIGIPPDLDLKGVKTLGLYLVTTLVEHQLQGTVDLDRSNGTEFRIMFRVLKHKERI